jgi:twitching motility protein PilT
MSNSLTLNLTPPPELTRLLDLLWQYRGTDLLITPNNHPLIRVDGNLHPLQTEPVVTPQFCADLATRFLSEPLIAVLTAEKEIDFSFAWEDRARFRANVFFQRGSVTFAMRMIPYRIPSFEELGLPPVIQQLGGLHQGLLLVTGPTGSGKSTTLASVIDYINTTRQAHILTIEDPIEYHHPHKRCAVNQREVGYDTLSFERALRAALREDPDVILVGEMRDRETMQIALTIAETGHLVLATLHTNDAPSAVERIVDTFPAERQNQIRLQLASSLAGVVAQRLVPRIGGGMVAAFEVLVATLPVRALIREGKTHQIRNVQLTSARDGMCVLESSLSWLVDNGIISYEDAVKKAVHAKDLKVDPAKVGQRVA